VGASSASRDPLAVFKGLLLRGGREERGRGWKGKGREEAWERKKRGQLPPNILA